MVIAAHPDDADFGPAATAARWIDAGLAWAGSCAARAATRAREDPETDPLELAALREREQRAAAAVVGYAGVTFLHMPDGALANDLILREHLVREIRTFEPDAVLATDPENLFPRDAGVNHADHRAAGYAAVDAVYPAARNPMAFPWLARAGLAAAPRPAPVPVLDAHSRRSTSTSRHGRSQDRCPALPREPAPRTSRRCEERIRAWAAEAGREIGAGGRRGLPPGGHRRGRRDERTQPNRGSAGSRALAQLGATQPPDLDGLGVRNGGCR